jgi:RNA polymerase sigma-70 factor, ECF subfamily
MILHANAHRRAPLDTGSPEKHMRDEHDVDDHAEWGLSVDRLGHNRGIKLREPATMCDVEGPQRAETRREAPTSAEWMQMYHTNSRPLLCFLLRLTVGNRMDAEDYLQETFLRAWRLVCEHPTDLATIRPWLFTVARNIAIDAARARRARPTEVLFEYAPAAAETSNEIECFALAHSVRDALRSLSADHRAALVELYYHEHTAKEAGSILGIPEGTVKSRAHYALRALSDAGLGDEGTQPRRRAAEPA